MNDRNVKQGLLGSGSQREGEEDEMQHEYGLSVLYACMTIKQ
jgi:hypothetical protein